MEVKPYLDKANDRLKTAKCRLRIHIKGGSLTLRGTLPPKPESDRVTQAFNRSKIPFNPYDLRHAWAIRTLQESWPVELSASLMGHSVDVHTKTYQRWITRERKMSIFDHLVRGLN